MSVIKICGITNLQDAIRAAQLGVDYLGFNFYPKSPRCVDVTRCAEISAVLQEDFPDVQRVGIFVNATIAEIEFTLQTGCLHLAQLHGDETPAFLSLLGNYAFKSIRTPDVASINVYANARDSHVPDFLLDASVPGAYGGTGVTADWEFAESISSQYDFFLAGGLSPANVPVAVRQVQPWGVDVASGVESRPGVKDVGKMKDFIAAVRQADFQKGQ